MDTALCGLEVGRAATSSAVPATLTSALLLLLLTLAVSPATAAMYATARGYQMDQPLLLGELQLDVAAAILQLQMRVDSLQFTIGVQAASLLSLNATILTQAAQLSDQQSTIAALQLLTNGTSTTLGLDQIDGHILVGGIVNKLQVLTAGTSEVLGLSGVDGTILTGGVVDKLHVLTVGTSDVLGLSTTDGSIQVGGTVSKLQVLTAGTSTALGLNGTDGTILTGGVIAGLQSSVNIASNWITAVEVSIGLDATGATTDTGPFKAAQTQMTTNAASISTLNGQMSSANTNLTNLLARRSRGAFSYYNGTPSGGYATGEWILQSSLPSFTTTSAGTVFLVAGCNFAGSQPTAFVNTAKITSSTSGSSVSSVDATTFPMMNSVALQVAAGETITCLGSLANYAQTYTILTYYSLGCTATYTFVPN